jgi:GNAT superfamily N-acetyltransferase
MKILNLTDGLSPSMRESIISLAVSEAPAMVGQHIDADSPLLALAEAEVAILLGESLDMVGAGVSQQFDDGRWFDLKVGVIAAIDDEAEGQPLVGMIQYKPRLMTDDVATIGYAAVAKDYRGRGIFKSMLEELKSTYPVLGLDCPLELVPFYEKLGFEADNAQGAHVGMSLGELSGKNWMQDQEHLENNPLYKRAKENIRDRLGKNTRDAYSRRDRDTQKRVDEIHAFLASRKTA